jgi:hypothetical protein
LLHWHITRRMLNLEPVECVDLTDMTELGIPESYAAQFKGKGIREVNLPARPFFFSSARIGFKNLLNRLNGEIKKAIK